MSESKAIPKGLKDQEVERGKLKRPPIPYIPVEDAVSDTVKTSKGKKDFKVKLPDGTEISHSLYDSGSNEAFMIHVQEVLSFCDRKQFFSLYAEAEQALDAAKTKAEAAQVKLDRALLNRNTTDVQKDALRTARDKAVSTETTALELLRQRGKKFFALYETLLGDNVRAKWKRIVSTQVGIAPWTDLYGTVHVTAREPSNTAFNDCVTFHLLSVFPNDAAERQKYYINHQLKKPRRIPIRNFANRIEQLNSYVAYLPGLMDSPQRTNMMRRVEGLDEPEVAQLLLRLVPQAHQDQYNLTKGIIPQNLRLLLETLETIENMEIHVPRKPEKSGETKDGKRKGSFKGDGNSNKKKKSDKKCALCEKHGGKHTTHNTGDCRKYEKDGALKSGFNKTAGKTAAKFIKKERHSYQAVLERLDKINTKLKKIDKKDRKSKKRRSSDSSDNSNDS